MRLKQNSISILLSLVFLCSCNVADKKTDSEKSNLQNTTIYLQPFDDLPDAYTNAVFNQFKIIFSKVELKKSIPLPKTAFNPQRQRYRADTIIAYLHRKNTQKDLTIGLTNKDISATKNKIQDWGVMGLGYCPGNTCVASTFRLNKEKAAIQLFKVAIHELGHTQGLAHCKIKYCFMRDAEGKNPTDEETDFCLNCKKFLLKKGWVLKYNLD